MLTQVDTRQHKTMTAIKQQKYIRLLGKLLHIQLMVGEGNRLNQRKRHDIRTAAASRRDEGERGWMGLRRLSSNNWYFECVWNHLTSLAAKKLCIMHPSSSARRSDSHRSPFTLQRKQQKKG